MFREIKAAGPAACAHATIARADRTTRMDLGTGRKLHIVERLPLARIIALQHI